MDQRKKIVIKLIYYLILKQKMTVEEAITFLARDRHCELKAWKYEMVPRIQVNKFLEKNLNGTMSQITCESSVVMFLYNYGHGLTINRIANLQIKTIYRYIFRLTEEIINKIIILAKMSKRLLMRSFGK